MSKVFTDQLAALPITEIVIRSIEGGMYIAFVALEGKLLRIYEIDGTPLCRKSVADVKSVLLEHGCGKKIFLFEHSDYDDMIGVESAMMMDMKLALG